MSRANMKYDRENKFLVSVVVGVWLILSAALLHAAFQMDLWREFVVSELLLMASSGALLSVLKRA